MKAELLVTDRSWPQRAKFLDALRCKLAAMPNRVAYYPGQSCCWSAGHCGAAVGTTVLLVHGNRGAMHASANGRVID